MSLTRGMWAPQRPMLLPAPTAKPQSLLAALPGADRLAGRSYRRLRATWTVASSKRQADTEEKQTPTKSGGKLSSSAPSDKDSSEQKDEGYSVFKPGPFMQPWQVPWGGKELVLGMGGWAASSVVVAGVVLLGARLVGPQLAELGVSRAGLLLALQVAEVGVGLGVIWAVVRGFGPLPPDVLKIDLREPFRKPDGWAFWALMGVAWSGAAIGGTAALFDAIGPYIGYGGPAGPGTADGVIALTTLDAPTFVAIFATTAILAPVLEEVVFRGFLLATLTKWMPVPAALLLSSAAFGAAHFNARDFPELTALGFLMGVCYVRSRNLLTPMIIHGASNAWSTIAIFALTAMGVDVRELIHGGGVGGP